MRPIFLITLLLFLFATACQSQPSAPSVQWDGGGLTATQQALVLEYTESFPDFSELSLALLTGDSVRLVGLRKTNRGLQTVSNANQLFEIGSVTKVFTAGILARFVAAGEMTLDAPVSTFLPISLRQPERDGTVVTLGHLANHTSGLPRLPDNLSPANVANPYADYDQDALYFYLENQQSLATPPGTQYAYSNLGFGLLGHLLAHRAKADYAALLRQYVTEPLAMSRTFAEVPLAWEYSLVKGHDPSGHITPNWDMGALAGAGTIKSTASDLATWLQANMNASAPTHAQWKLCQSPTFTVNENLSLGLGWHIVKKGEVEFYWHNGGTGGYTSFVAFDPASETGAVVLSNVSAFSPHMTNIDQLGFRILASLDEEQ